MEISNNPAKIPWPSDNVGMTSRLKREGCRAIGRMSGRDENLEIVMQVLRLLAQHAQDKLSEQKDIRQGNLVNLAQQRAEAAKAAENASSAVEKHLSNQVETLKNRLAAFQKRKEQAILRETNVQARRKVVLSEIEQARVEQGIGSAKS